MSAVPAAIAATYHRVMRRQIRDRHALVVAFGIAVLAAVIALVAAGVWGWAATMRDTAEGATALADIAAANRKGQAAKRVLEFSIGVFVVSTGAAVALAIRRDSDA